MMKKSILILIFSSLLASCWRDSVPDSCYVNDFTLRMVYGEYGKSETFPEPLSVSMTNTTEQYTYGFDSSADGSVIVKGVMPGHYTITVSGKLGERHLAGFVNSMILTIG